MIEDRIFMNSRYEQFKDGENEQWYFDELTKTIYSVFKMKNGCTQITENPEDSDSYNDLYEYYLQFKGNKFRISMEIVVDEDDPDVVGKVIQKNLGNDIFVKNMVVEKRTEEK